MSSDKGRIGPVEARWRGARGEPGEKGDRGDPGMTRSARRAVLVLFALILCLAAANLLFTARQVNNLRSAVLTQCKFDRDLGSAPIAVSPATGKPSLLGVTIVSDSRVAWHGLGCPGQLGPAAPSFQRWAKAYHLPEG